MIVIVAEPRLSSRSAGLWQLVVAYLVGGALNDNND